MQKHSLNSGTRKPLRKKPSSSCKRHCIWAAIPSGSCFDTSNISGSDLVASMVAFTEGMRDSKRQRYFHIRGIAKGDDYAALHQVLSRRLLRAKKKTTSPISSSSTAEKGSSTSGLGTCLKSSTSRRSISISARQSRGARHEKGDDAGKVSFLPPTMRSRCSSPLRSPSSY